MKAPGSKSSKPALLARRIALAAVSFLAGFWIREKMRPSHPATALSAASPAATPEPPANPPAPTAAPATAPTAAPEIVDLTTRHLTQDDTALISKTSMTPELARTLLAKVKAENKDVNERALLCAVILGALSKSGHVDEAWKLIEESPGTVRVMEIANIDFSTIPMESDDQQRAVLGSIIFALQTARKEKDPVTGETIMGKLFDLVRTGKMNGKYLNRVIDADPATGQRVIFSVGQAAIRSGEFATARQWSDRLLNPRMKQALVDQIEAAEKSRDTAPR